MLQSDLFDILIDLVELIKGNVEIIKQQLSTILTLLSLFMYFKLKFFDAGMYGKMQKLYGKSRLVDALTIVLRLLKTFRPDELITRIKLTDGIQSRMSEAIDELRNILNPFPLKPPEIKFSKKEEKVLTDRIKILIKLIGKQADIHEIAGKEGFVDKLTKNIASKDKYTDADQILKDTGKKVLLDLQK